MNADGPKQELIRRWQTEFIDIPSRNKLIEDMIAAKLFPDEDRVMDSVDTSWYQEEIKDYEEAAGLFPDIADPLFIPKLYRKREFAELKQPSMSEMIEEAEKQEMIVEEKRKRGEPVEPEIKDFEISPVQRFVSRFLSPATPYNSALLYHGVGVGKTCAAVTTAEAFLERYPNRPVLILAPPNIQANFRREIFDIGKVKWGDGQTIPNQSSGCTGSTYLQLSGCLYKRNVESSLVKYRVDRVIDKRYMIFGYIEFANYLEGLLKKSVASFMPPKQKARKQMEVIRETFSGRLIIVDEAHNLRESFEGVSKKSEAEKGTEELPEPSEKEVEDDEDADSSPQDKKAHDEGKRSAAKLMEVLDKSEGCKLMLLTATPMYNDPGDLVFLLNLLLRNDKRALLRMTPPGTAGSLFKKDKTLTEEGKVLIGNAASAYISFMRGENPLNFPVRTKPLNVPTYGSWTDEDVNGKRLEDADEKERLLNLPFIPCRLRDKALDYNMAAMQSVKKISANYNSEMFFSQAANVIFPNAAGKSKETGKTAINDCIGKKGFEATFVKDTGKTGSGNEQFIPKINPGWMSLSEIGKYSPKMEFVIKRLRTCQGVAFVYSRFINAGGLTFAIALEVNGYKAAGARTRNILSEDNFVGQCALCEQKSNAHTNKEHEFTQAYYVFLSGEVGLSGNNRESIDAATSASGETNNVDGSKVKVIIGSTVAGEGIDLKFIREIYVLDTWFHLNKLEQILGRGIRNKSHIALPRSKRNLTVYLPTNQFPPESMFGQRETTDMFYYRYALNKAFRMGVINRFIKQNALDCNLNYEAVVITGIQQKRDQIDSQGNELIGKDAVDLNDQPFTSICDWQDEKNCSLKCTKPVDLTNPIKGDTMTYDDYGSRYKTTQLRERLRKIFLQQPFYSYKDLSILFKDIPEIALVNLLSEIVNNRDFLFGTSGKQGYITFRNGYYLFQPIRIVDVRIPMAIRAAEYPVKRDNYEPEKLEAVKIEEGRGTVRKSTEGDLRSLWMAILGWCQILSTVNKDGKMPDDLTRMIETRYEYSVERRRRVIEELSMITFFYNSIRDKKPIVELFGKVVLCFLWDEYLTNEEQKSLFKILYNDPVAKPLMNDVWRENVMMYSNTYAFRVVNRDTADIEYFTLKGTELVKETIGRAIELFDSKSTTYTLRANNETCGFLYGTVNVKRGEFVFKTNEPVPKIPEEEYEKNPKIEDKGKKGRECAASSNTTLHKTKLYKLGEVALRASSFGTDMGLNKERLKSIDKPNSNMICTLLNLSFRMLDAKQVENKSWFFRPVATIKTGHPSMLPESYKLSKK